MTDYGMIVSDSTLAKLNKELVEVYGEAAKDIDEKIKDFYKRYTVKDVIHREQLRKGEITQEEYNRWQAGQIFQGKQWKIKKHEIEQVLVHSNEAAVSMINSDSMKVFGTNYNYQKYMIENKYNTNFGFQPYDLRTVSNLIKNNPKILPEWKVDEPKDYVWNGKKVNRQITQGIIQGEPLTKIADRLAKNLCSQNMNKMKMFAQTAMTGAQNAGRNRGLTDMDAGGLTVVKRWMATLDTHTRDTHRAIDGETRPADTETHEYKFSNGCRYPADPEGPPREVFNCRCTLVGDLAEFPSNYDRYDNIDGVPIGNISYDKWYDIKYKQKHISAANFVWDKHYNGTFGRDYGKADTSDALQEIKNGSLNSLAEYMDENGNLTPERVALHKQIIDNYLRGKTPEEKQAIMTMMGGGPASGKSSVLKAGLYELPDPSHSVIVDPDDIKQYLPGFREMSKRSTGAAAFYHEESSMLAKQLAATCFTENFNVTYDGTGDGSIGSVMKKINGARSHGYIVNGVYVTVNIDEALVRNRKRYDDAVANGESPRLVPSGYVINCHKKVTQISMEVSDKFDKILLYDTNGNKAKLIARGGSGKKLRAIRGGKTAFKDYLDKVYYDK